MDKVILIIRGKKFKASKAKLSEYSDYFRAMFNGDYVEKEKKYVNIDVVDPNIIRIILQYMRIGLIDLSEHSLSIIEELAMAASFLQVTELLKQIRYYLDTTLCISNWAHIMKIADLATFIDLKQLAAAHGLFAFKRMKPEYIPTIHKLYWYLSHPYLDTDSEFEVFKLGHQWIIHNGSGGDALLLILCCLDYKRLTESDLQKMVELIDGQYTNSLAEKVIECLREHVDNDNGFFMSYFTKHKLSICEKYTTTVYKEVVNLIRSTIIRTLVYTPAVPMLVLKDNKPEVVPHYLYTYKMETGFEKWLEVADKNLWGWSVISWGLTKVVVVCGEKGRGTGIFMKDVRVYDVLRKEWIQHGVNLPPRRHAGLALVDDSLFLLGGVGRYRVVLDSATLYNLKNRTFRKIASLPDAIQSPSTCVHNREVYTCGQKNIYKYDEERDSWNVVVRTEMRPNCMISFNGSIHCTQNSFSHFFRVTPDDVEMVTWFTCPPVEISRIGDRVLVFTRTMCGHRDTCSTVEEYCEYKLGGKPNILWAQDYTELKVNDVAGSCVLVMTIPPIDVNITQSHKRYLDRFTEE